MTMPVSASRALEATLDANGLSSTARAVQARVASRGYVLPRILARRTIAD